VTLYQGGVALAEVVRSGFVESLHSGSVAVLGADGSVVAEVGDPSGAVFPRSSNKPMQAVAMLRAGLPIDQPDELALVAASHFGEPMHLERIRSMLDRGGLSEADLRCPPDWPLSESARAEVSDRQRLRMNCSGKHTGMLLTCQAAGWSLPDYLSPEHPLQRACHDVLGDLAAEKIAATGVDGCGAPVFAMSLTGLARAFLALVSARPGTAERAVADAMRSFPELVSGTGADDARLMPAVPGLLSKVGAEGVIAVAIPDVGAVALKIDDGANRARLPVLARGLAHLGIASADLDAACEVPVLGGGGPVGRVTALPW
jgi:L-asparaginase II